MQRIFFIFTIASLLVTSCGAGQLFGPTITPSPTITLTSTSTPTPTQTPTPTVTLTPTSTHVPTVEEAFGHLAPLDFEYTLGDRWSGAYGRSYKEAEFQSFFTGRTRVVERFDEWSKRDITHTEIQVVLRDENNVLHALWLSFGSNDFKYNSINLQEGRTNGGKNGSVGDLLKLLSIGSIVEFGFFWDTPTKSPITRWCSDSDPDFCNDYSIVKFYLARSNIEFLHELRDGEFPEQAVLDDMVIPVEYLALVLPIKTVPVWEPLDELSLYDDFSGIELDKTRWKPNPVYSSVFSSSLSDGVLELRAQTKTEDGYFELRMNQLQRASNASAFEAQIRIPKRAAGQWGAIFMKVLARLSSGREWVTECFISSGSTTVKPFFGCDINGDGHYTPQVDVQLNRWYTIRIEIDSTSGAIQWSLDGQPIEAYLPDDASDLAKTSFTPLIAIWAKANTNLTVQIDNVSIATP